MAALLKPAQLLIPEYGVIKGGVLDGWTYTFLRLVLVDRRVGIDIKCAPEHWPFPMDVRLGKADFSKFRNPGEVAKVIEAQPLIEAARELAKTGKNK